MNLVFVYGTLKKGKGNDHLLKGAEFLGQNITPPSYSMYSLGYYPAVTLNGDTRIVGEVYAVDDQTMENLDRLEGYPNYYDRVLIPTDFGEAWMYVMDQDHFYPEVRRNKIMNGVW